MKYQYIKQHRDQDLSLETTCKLLGVSRSGYYKWRNRAAGRSAQEHRECLLIRQVWEASGKTYGSPRIYHELCVQGIKISQKRVAKLMKKLGIAGAGKKRRKPQTTVSTAAHPVAERLFKTEASRAYDLAPNQIWAGDITYVRLIDNKCCYLSILLDIATRKITGYSIQSSLHATLTLDTLEMAIAQERPQPGLIIHTDRGTQYTCQSYRELVLQQGFNMSMSRKGNCYDNAFVESLFRSLKVELVNRCTFKSIEEARSAIFRYIVWYNGQRRHSALGYICPVDYEESITKRA